MPPLSFDDQQLHYRMRAAAAGAQPAPPLVVMAAGGLTCGGAASR